MGLEYAQPFIYSYKLGTNTLGSPVYENRKNNRAGLLITYAKKIQFPLDSHHALLQDQLCITIDLISSAQECMKVLL